MCNNTEKWITNSEGTNCKASQRKWQLSWALNKKKKGEIFET